MRAARIGWFLVVLAVLGGYAFGRYRKGIANKRRVEATLPRVNARSPQIQVSTRSAQELELPSDSRYINSLPRKTE